MKLLLLAALMAGMCATSSPPKPDPSPTPSPTATVTIPDPPPAPDADAGTDPIALELCTENFEALNPDLSKQAVIDLFCSTPEALAPWALRAADKRAH